MTRSPLYGFLLATAGALILTPDTMFMRWSEMSGAQMLGWRGLCMGAVMLGLWALRGAPGNRELFSRAGIAVVLCHCSNAVLFTLGIAVAPVAVVLFGVATTPVFAALFAHLAGQRTGPSTWIAIAAVMTGIFVAIFGSDERGIAIDVSSALGGLAGLCVAATMALSFVIIRNYRAVPIQPVIGYGSLLAGIVGMVMAGGPAALAASGHVWSIAVTGLVILPASFLALTHASRHTAAANVSLLLLLETVLGPIWVWAFADETMSWTTILGGAIVVVSLAVYLLTTAMRRPA